MHLQSNIKEDSSFNDKRKVFYPALDDYAHTKKLLQSPHRSLSPFSSIVVLSPFNEFNADDVINMTFIHLSHSSLLPVVVFC